MNHLINISDHAADQLADMLALAQRPPADLGQPLQGQGAALIFEKPSNRTRHSMEMAVVQLGGHPVYTRGEEVCFDHREPVEDIARIMAGYHGIIAARVFEHSTVTRLAAAAPTTPIVNMLSDYSHPLQALADALTMIERLGTLDKARVAWVGDYNNVARSLGEICVLLGADIAYACPDGYQAPADELQRLDGLGTGEVSQTTSPTEAVAGANAIHTDTWVSMGDESEKAERLATFDGYQVDAEMMAHAADGAIFMHCLPAYRDVEVAADVIDGPASAVFQQGHNRLHAARGALAYLLGVRP